jgi:hypothetical protein
MSLRKCGCDFVEEFAWPSSFYGAGNLEKTASKD